jgi:hypothetical protein
MQQMRYLLPSIIQFASYLLVILTLVFILNDSTNDLFDLPEVLGRGDPAPTAMCIYLHK